MRAMRPWSRSRRSSRRRSDATHSEGMSLSRMSYRARLRQEPGHKNECDSDDGEGDEKQPRAGIPQILDQYLETRSSQEDPGQPTHFMDRPTASAGRQSNGRTSEQRRSKGGDPALFQGMAEKVGDQNHDKVNARSTKQEHQKSYLTQTGHAGHEDHLRFPLAIQGERTSDGGQQYHPSNPPGLPDIGCGITQEKRSRILQQAGDPSGSQ